MSYSYTYIYIYINIYIYIIYIYYLFSVSYCNHIIIKSSSYPFCIAHQQLLLRSTESHRLCSPSAKHVSVGIVQPDSKHHIENAFDHLKLESLLCHVSCLLCIEGRSKSKHCKSSSAHPSSNQLQFCLVIEILR